MSRKRSSARSSANTSAKTQPKTGTAKAKPRPARSPQRRAPQVQPKLKVGAPGDRFEREADEMADTVMRRPEGDTTENEDEQVVRPKPLPGAASRSAGGSVESQVRALRGGGQALAPSLRSFFEPRFGRNFDDVRVHTGRRASAAASSLDARAFTLGRDVVFGDGEYNPGSSGGRRLLAHELTHVVQQTQSTRRGPWEGRQVERKSTPDSPPVGAVQRAESGPDALVKAHEALTKSKRISSPKTSLDKKLAKAAKIFKADMIPGVFKEEKERTGTARQIGEFLGVGTSTFGRGALGEPAYKDVEKNFPDEKAAYAKLFGSAPARWIDAVEDKNWVVFYTAAYLFLQIALRQEKGRSQDTQARLGIALYHGGFKTVAKAQKAAAKKLKKEAKDLTWAEIEVELKKLPKGPDIIDYVAGVMSHKISTVKKDVEFEVKAQLVGTTKFVVGEYGFIRISLKADYDRDVSKMPADKRPPSTYWVTINGDQVKYEVGESQYYIWRNLPAGTYNLKIHNRHAKGDIPLKGKGEVTVRF